MTNMMKHLSRIQRELNIIKKQREEALERLYDLNLAPFRGYYEKKLELEKK